MDPSRSKKSRSLALESKTATQKSSQRPGPGERRTSAPTVARSRHSTAKSASENSKDVSASATSRSSRASATKDPSGRSSVVKSTRLEERPRDSRSKGRSVPEAAASDIQEIYLAVVGARGVGKSTFIQHALDLRKSTNGPVSSSKVALSGVTYRVQLLELGLDDIDYSARQVKWPKNINSQLVPPIDGVLCLYDITDQESIAEIPELLRALTKAATPCVLTGCKCDQPSKYRKVDPGFNGQIGSSFPGVQTGEVSATAPESSKRCILNILKAILAPKEPSRQLSPNATRPRAATGQDRTASSRRTSASNSRSHSRSKSDFPASSSKPYDTPQTSSEVLPETEESEESSSEDEDTESDDDEADEEDEDEPVLPKQPLRLDTSPSPRQQTRPYEPQTPVSAEGRYINALMSPFEGGQSDGPQTPDSFNVADIARPGTANTADSRAHQTFLFLEEESQDESSQSERHPSISEFERMKIIDKEKNEVGMTFPELTGRLLALPTKKQDKKFQSMFLCLYRAFSTPRLLLTSIINRFNEVESSPSVQLTKVAMQLRYLQVMGEWTAAYPGDFADAVTRHIAQSFVSRLEKSRSFGPAAKEIGNNLEAYVEDDDAAWSYVDPTDPKARTPKLTPQSSTGPGSPNQGAKDARGNRADILPWEYPIEESNDDDSNVDANSSPRHSGAPSTASSLLLKTTNASSQSLTNLLNLENARMRAQRLRPVPRTRLSKIQWHQFMDEPPEDIAREITRIDWIMYSAIRPRDFVRHVMGSSKDRKQKKGTLNDNIGAMVKHFNHLAVFVSGMILLRDKPKHRAKAVEKWMSIAWKVRQLNNYNSLGAIVAGINGHEIARLSQTRELVPPQIQKDFLRLTILMGLSRGHAAYRLAWENSFAERIPFIPLLRQDLTLASNGMSTWIEKEGAERKINWRKFEIMGDVIVMIQNSQQSGYKFSPRDEEIVKLILETRVLEGSEDSADPRGELYERSVQIEPAGAGGEAGRKKFDWFRR